MRTSQREVIRLLESGRGVVARREHPEVATTLDWWVRQERLRPLLPGVYVDPSLVRDTATQIRAAMLWAPDAVLLGRAAAKVSFWPSLKVGDVELAVGSRCTHAAGFRLTRRRVPADLVEERHGLRFSSPALTALDLCDTLGGDGIDTALRARAATLSGLRAALELSKNRRGNQSRRRLLFDSRSEPWSAAERRCHQLLYDAGIVGWRANVAVPSLGSVYFVDVAFEDILLAIEIDGRLHEDDPGVFESDRWRQNHLTLAGWTVLRFTWAMVTQHPDLVIQTICRARDSLLARR